MFNIHLKSNLEDNNTMSYGTGYNPRLYRKNKEYTLEEALDKVWLIKISNAFPRCLEGKRVKLIIQD